jgi:D-ribose pyranose/furanose isomerase RbsD
MSTQLTLDQRKQRIETSVKIGLLGVAGFLVAPIILHTIVGIAGLAVAGFLGLAIINLAPAVAAQIANWRLKALKAVAARNPIETLENRYSQLKDSLLKQRDNIKQRIAIASKIYDQIKSFESQFNILIRDGVGVPYMIVVLSDGELAPS